MQETNYSSAKIETEDKKFRKLKKIRNLVSFSIIIIIFFLFAYYIYRHIGEFQQLKLVNPFYIIILIAIFVFSLYINSLLLRALMKPFNVNIESFEGFGLSVITSFYNLITPFHGGAGARAVYLKKKHNFPFVYFLATLSAIYVIIFFISSIGGLLSMGLIWMNFKIFNPIILFIFLFFFLFLLGIMVFSLKISETKNNWINKFIKVVNGWHLIRKNRKVILIVSLISIIQLILNSLSLTITYSIFGFHLDFSKALFITSIGSISAISSVTPGNLGIGDAIAIFSANILGVGLSYAIAANILGRAIGFLVIFILGPIFSYIMLRYKVKKKRIDICFKHNKS